MIQFEPLSQTSSGRYDGIGHHGKGKVLRQVYDRICGTVDDIGRHVDLHLLILLDDEIQCGFRETTAETVDHDLEPFAYTPGNELRVPHMVERGICGITGQPHFFLCDGRVIVQRVPQQITSLLFLRPQTLGRPFGFV